MCINECLGILMLCVCVCVCVCVLAHITVTVTLSGSDSGFLGVSSVLLIRQAVASEQTHSQLLTHPSVNLQKEESLHVLIQVFFFLLLSRVH